MCADFFVVTTDFVLVAELRAEGVSMWRPVGPQGTRSLGDVVVRGTAAPAAAVMVVDAMLRRERGDAVAGAATDAHASVDAGGGGGDVDGDGAGANGVEAKAEEPPAALASGDDGATLRAFVEPHGYAYRWHSREELTDPESLSVWYPRPPDRTCLPCLALSCVALLSAPLCVCGWC